MASGTGDTCGHRALKSGTKTIVWASTQQLTMLFLHGEIGLGESRFHALALKIQNLIMGHHFGVQQVHGSSDHLF